VLVRDGQLRHTSFPQQDTFAARERLLGSEGSTPENSRPAASPLNWWERTRPANFQMLFTA
jgi:hypothetical protein